MIPTRRTPYPRPDSGRADVSFVFGPDRTAEQRDDSSSDDYRRITN